MRTLSRWLVVLVLASTLSSVPPASADTSTGGFVEYVHPVRAEIIEGFRAPITPYGPGHRGIKYATPNGMEVGAAAGGVVVFAGPVAGSLHVTIRHGDGRLTSYSYLEKILVQVGQNVAIGQTVGLTGGVLHVGVREAGTYIDPETLFGTVGVKVTLVPENDPGGELWGAADEAVELAILAWFDGSGSALGSLWSATSGLARGLWVSLEALAPVVELVSNLLGPLVAVALASPIGTSLVAAVVVAMALGLAPGVHDFLAEHSLTAHLTNVYRNTLEWWESRKECTNADVEPEPPDDRRFAVLVDGFGSTSDSRTISGLPLEALGYETPDVIRFSYEGGRTPMFEETEVTVVSAELRHIPVFGYDKSASTTDLLEKGVLLADLMSEVVVATPADSQVDIYAHSQGGLVLRLALIELESRPGGEEVIARLGLITTIDSPHQGADVAAIAGLLSSNDAVGTLFRLAAPNEFDPSVASNIAHLAPRSDLIDHLSEHQLPEGPSYLAIGATTDLTVTPAHSRLEGATNVVVSAGLWNTHSGVISHPSTEREVSLALAGLPPTCVGFFNFLVNTAVRTGIEVAMGAVGTAAAIVATPLLFSESMSPAILAIG